MSTNDAPGDGQDTGEETGPRTRRESGARRQTSEPVELYREDRIVTGWSLNVSRGGARLVLDENVYVGDAFDLVLGDYDFPEIPRRHGVKVVWVKSSPGGCVAGVAFDDAGSFPPPALTASLPPPPFVPSGLADPRPSSIPAGAGSSPAASRSRPVPPMVPPPPKLPTDDE